MHSDLNTRNKIHLFNVEHFSKKNKCLAIFLPEEKRGYWCPILVLESYYPKCFSCSLLSCSACLQLLQKPVFHSLFTVVSKQIKSLKFRCFSQMCNPDVECEAASEMIWNSTWVVNLKATGNL